MTICSYHGGALGPAIPDRLGLVRVILHALAIVRIGLAKAVQPDAEDKSKGRRTDSTGQAQC